MKCVAGTVPTRDTLPVQSKQLQAQNSVNLHRPTQRGTVPRPVAGNHYQGTF